MVKCCNASGVFGPQRYIANSISKCSSTCSNVLSPSSAECLRSAKPSDDEIVFELTGIVTPRRKSMMSKWNYDNEHLKKRVLELEIGLSIVFRRVFFCKPRSVSFLEVTLTPTAAVRWDAYFFGTATLFTCTYNSTTGSVIDSRCSAYWLSPS